MNYKFLELKGIKNTQQEEEYLIRVMLERNGIDTSKSVEDSLLQLAMKCQRLERQECETKSASGEIIVGDLVYLYDKNGIELDHTLVNVKAYTAHKSYFGDMLDDEDK